MAWNRDGPEGLWAAPYVVASAVSDALATMREEMTLEVSEGRQLRL